MNTLHAHIDTDSTDCDGPHERSWIETFTDEEVARSVAAAGVNDFTDLEFKARVLDSQVTYHPMEGEWVTVKITRDGFTVEEPTDEGYRSSSVRWCEDAECDTNERSQRDVYAEMMGY